MENTRLILFVALSVILLMIWQAWEREQMLAMAPGATTNTSVSTNQGEPSSHSDVPAVTAPGGDVPSVGKAPGVTAADSSAETAPASTKVRVTTDVLHLEIDTRGAEIVTLDLPRYPMSLEAGSAPLRLMAFREGDALGTQSGLIAREGAWPNHRSLYTSPRDKYTLTDAVLPKAGIEKVLRVPFQYRGGGGIEVEKTYILHPGSYVVGVEYRVRNGGTSMAEVWSYRQFAREFTEKEHSWLDVMPSYTGGAIYTPTERYEKVGFDDMKEKPLARETESGWVAMQQHYFVSAWLLDGVGAQTLYSSHENGRYTLGAKSRNAVSVAPGGTQTIRFALYAGPKDQAGVAKVAEGLDLTVDYGVLTFIAAPLFWLLGKIHGFIGNWGWAIIVVTLLIKAAFHPLTAASYKSMAMMRKLHPKMTAIKERHANDRQKMNQAMMEMYKTEKLNPLGGCLPMIVQIPVFVALYWVLLESVELRQAPWAFWIHDLSAKDPYYILPLLMGATMLAQQWLNPQPLDPIQQKVMMAMPVVFTVFFVFFPAGLVLYWVVQNLISVAQQWWINKAIAGG